MLKRSLIALSFLLLAAPAFAFEGGAPRAEAPSAAHAPATTRVLPQRAALATRTDRSRYAAREAASPEAKQYRGGDDVVIIGGSALALVLAIVLIIVLI